ncbi:MAG: hypothetical protein IJU00_13725, partial [Selenomonas sp.]|nr:hypothetical protein [Selenomonas sp.]
SQQKMRMLEASLPEGGFFDTFLSDGDCCNIMAGKYKVKLKDKDLFELSERRRLIWKGGLLSRWYLAVEYLAFSWGREKLFRLMRG